MPETLDVEDAADRAMRKRKLGDNARIDLDRIGFWPDNKDGIGVSSRHIHEIAEDIMNNKTRFNRHEPAKLLELLGPRLKKIRGQNKAKCHNDPLMPRYAAIMEYVSVDKNHFIHACKLFKDGNHTLFNLVPAHHLHRYLLSSQHLQRILPAHLDSRIRPWLGLLYRCCNFLRQKAQKLLKAS